MSLFWIDHVVGVLRRERLLRSLAEKESKRKTRQVAGSRSMYTHYIYICYIYILLSEKATLTIEVPKL